MKIAVCQMNIQWEDKEANLAKIGDFCQKAKVMGADVIFFPEMSCTGFTMNTRYSAETKENLYTLGCIKTIAVENVISIGVGWVYKKDDMSKCENHYSVVDKFGNVISDYVKIHPFSYSNENKHFEGGTELSLYSINDIPFSTFICYDLRFPEIFRLVNRNSHVIVVPANWPERRREHWTSLLKARAIENQVYIIGVNCVGKIGDLSYVGDSSIISPDGTIVACAKTGIEEVVYYEIEDDVDTFRTIFPVLEDTKDELYFGLRFNNE